MKHTNRFFLLLLLLSIHYSSIAQTQVKNAAIDWGEELNEPAGTFLSKIISSQGSGFYALREKRIGSLRGNANKIFVEHYSSSNRKLLKSKALDLRYKKKERVFEDVIMLGGKLHLLTSFHNEAKKINYLFAQSISSKSLNLSKDLKKIGEIGTINAFKEGSFDIHISRDSSKILVMNQLPYKKTQPERFALQVFDNDFNTIWNRDIILPYNDQQFEIKEYRVDGTGNVYLLGLLYLEGTREQRRGKPNYQYLILSYPADGSKSRKHKIKLGEKFITDLTFRISKEGLLVCSGFYSDQDAYSIKGTYFFQLDPESREIRNQNFKAFSLNFLVDDFSAGKQRRIQKANENGTLRQAPELRRYALDDLILRSDGGVVLIAEQYFVQERNNRDFYGNNIGTRFNNNNINSDFYFNYHDIIVVNIRPNGEIEWASRIPKRQVTINDGGYYSSYAMSIVSDKLYFVFNDNGRNYEDKRRIQGLYNFNGNQSIIAVAELSKDGSVNVAPLFQNREAGIITRPKVCRQTGKRKMIIYGERGRRYRFAQLEFLPNGKI